MATPEILLTEDQRLEFTQIPQNISEYEIVKYYTFSTYDIGIINKHRRDYNRLGFAIQLALLRNPGWSLISINNIPESVLNYIAEQIQVSPKELELYAQRENTRLEHLQEIREIYGFKNYTDQHTQSLIQTLLPYAIENDNVINLMKLAINEIKIHVFYTLFLDQNLIKNSSTKIWKSTFKTTYPSFGFFHPIRTSIHINNIGFMS